MKKQIRQGIWETNSSSSHSISIDTSGEISLELLSPSEDGIFYIGPGGETEFEGQDETYYGVLDKINYAYLTAECAKDDTYKEMLYKIIKHHTGAKVVEPYLYLKNWSWGEIEEDRGENAIRGKLYMEGGECDISMFKDEPTLYNFIFNKNSYIETTYNG